MDCKESLSDCLVDLHFCGIPIHPDHWNWLGGRYQRRMKILNGHDTHNVDCKRAGRLIVGLWSLEIEDKILWFWHLTFDFLSDLLLFTFSYYCRRIMWMNWYSIIKYIYREKRIGRKNGILKRKNKRGLRKPPNLVDLVLPLSLSIIKKE